MLPNHYGNLSGSDNGGAVSLQCTKVHSRMHLPLLQMNLSRSFISVYFFFLQILAAVTLATFVLLWQAMCGNWPGLAESIFTQNFIDHYPRYYKCLLDEGKAKLLARNVGISIIRSLPDTQLLVVTLLMYRIQVPTHFDSSAILSGDLNPRLCSASRSIQGN